MTTQLKVFSGIFVGVIVIGGLILYAVSPDDTENSNTVVTNSTVSEANEYELYDTAEGELRFTNNEHGYQLILPEGWDAFTPEEASADLSFVWFEDSVAQTQTEEGELVQGMKMEIYVDPAIYSSVDEWYAVETEWLTPEERLEEKETTVGDEPAKKIEIDVLGYTLSTFVIHDDQQFTIAGYIGDSEDKEKYSAIYSKILSTFKFLD